MTPLSRVINEIQREAAGVPTKDLRADIEIGFEVLDAAITQLHALRPGADVIEQISANAEVLETAFTIALYVRELATRPADPILPVPLSFN
jgi:hypothetical protein